ncbi:unannotated protein [freshwater metagenome]|uniref:Unannotated protein n=1 Tax=freshwater metagenome TaxID=449393 RepID=A0A6J7UNP6_9ZZZZ
MRSLPGSAPTSCIYGRIGAAAITRSPTPGPCVASSNAAVSRTVLVTAKCTLKFASSPNGAREIRPCEVFNPTRPQHEAGTRILPPPSLACAIGIIPAATAAALPPLEPPGVSERSHGFRVAPQASGSVTGTLPNSGEFARPKVIRPVSINR